jgi:hypothetical protein
MDAGDRASACPQCGRLGCAGCAPPVAAPEFRVLRGGGEPVAAPVRLVREFKGPNVRDVLLADPEELDLLPGRVRAMEQAIDGADLAEAERRLDRALGSLLAGPAPRRSDARRALAHAAWLLLIVAAAAAAYAWLVG